MSSEHSKFLFKTAAGYPGLTLTEANVLAFLEEFSGSNLEDFKEALTTATTEAPSFFPTLPMVKQSMLQIHLRRARQKEENLKLPEPRSPLAKREGWLTDLFNQKRAGFQRNKTA